MNLFIGPIWSIQKKENQKDPEVFIGRMRIRDGLDCRDCGGKRLLSGHGHDI